jgi:transcriptional regulator with XRE-family HTH domain
MAAITSDLTDYEQGVSLRAIRKQLGRRAQRARLAARRSQLAVARAAGVSLPTLQRFESGANVSIEALIRIAVALNAERGLSELFPLPDARTIDEILERRKLPQRGRTK